jgi:hypothetical protein
MKIKTINIQFATGTIIGIVAIATTLFTQEIREWILTFNLWQVLFILLFFCSWTFLLLGYTKAKAKKTENDIEDLKEKIIGLKEFRDKEALRVINHYNAQLHSIEDRIDLINRGNKFFMYSDYEDPNDKKNHIENRKQSEIEVIGYNEIFRDWGIGNYGVNNNSQTIYRGKNYGV